MHAIHFWRRVTCSGNSRVPGRGVRDSRAWQDRGHRVTLINNHDDGGDHDGQGQDGRAGIAAQGGV
jgi:hypothetical protein